MTSAFSVTSVGRAAEGLSARTTMHGNIYQISSVTPWSTVRVRHAEKPGKITREENGVILHPVILQLVGSFILCKLFFFGKLNIINAPEEPAF